MDDPGAGSHRHNGLRRGFITQLDDDHLSDSSHYVGPHHRRTGYRHRHIGSHQQTVPHDSYAALCALFGSERRHVFADIRRVHHVLHRQRVLHHGRHLWGYGSIRLFYQARFIIVGQASLDGPHRTDYRYPGQCILG